MRRTPALAAAVVLGLLAGGGLFVVQERRAAAVDPFPGTPRPIAPGVSLFHVTDQGLLNPPAPVSIWILRVDPARAAIRAALANDEIVDTETVPEIAARHRAAAAINAGFFLLPSGDPAGIYKLRGQLVSDTRRARGAVGLLNEPAGQKLLFGRLTATIGLRIGGTSSTAVDVAIAGVDTTRLIGKLMLFTPAYHEDTDTAPGGLEWVIDGQPLRVTAGPFTGGRTPIPRSGFVLSFGGPRAPPSLARLRKGTQVNLDTRYEPVEGTADDWARTTDIVGGAGLLLRDGAAVSDWSMEKFSTGFAETRHPRTAIGARPDGTIWLIAVDGRQPSLSNGMSLEELRALARRLGLANALNLDGGGSTTMWVDGTIVNSPSDRAGPRKVSDAFLVMPR